MLTPLLFLIVFMGVITAPGLIALHLEDRRAKNSPGDGA